ncbi:MAG: hypothetical protein OSB69_22330 [Alphaproteobacteria bacterium]|nr:hypothetical protein [Alphaproteobacteria bacterium]
MGQLHRTMTRARVTGRAPAFAAAFLVAMLLMVLHWWSTDLRFEFVDTYK